MVVHHSILVMEQREEGVLGVQQHLPLPLLLGLPGRVSPLLQRQDLQQKAAARLCSLATKQNKIDKRGGTI